MCQNLQGLRLDTHLEVLVLVPAVYSAITVLDSKGQVMQQNIGIVPSQQLIAVSFAASGGRKLLAAGAPRASAPQAAPGNGSRASALGRPGNDSACAGGSWVLPLNAGQNVFSIAHGDLKANLLSISPRDY